MPAASPVLYYPHTPLAATMGLAVRIDAGGFCDPESGARELREGYGLAEELGIVGCRKDCCATHVPGKYLQYPWPAFAL